MSRKILSGPCKFRLFDIKRFWILEIFVHDLFLHCSYTHLFVRIYTKKCLHVDKYSGMAAHLLAKQKFSAPNIHSMLNISNTQWNFMLHRPLRWRLASDKLLNRHHIHGQRHKNVLLFRHSRVSRLRDPQMKTQAQFLCLCPQMWCALHDCVVEHPCTVVSIVTAITFSENCF